MLKTKSLTDDVERPAVLLGLMGDLPQSMVENVVEGMEEEGISCRLVTLEIGDKTAAAKSLAQSSRINVGIVISKLDSAAVLHHRDLPEDQPLFILNSEQMTPGKLHCLGQNAARLVKGNPLIFEDKSSDREMEKQGFLEQKPGVLDNDLVQTIAEYVLARMA